MAYRDDIAALNPDHHYVFEANGVDLIGANTGTASSLIVTTAIAEDATNSLATNAVGDNMSIPAIAAITDEVDRKALGGFVMMTNDQLPPKVLYSEGGTTTSYKLLMGFGNNLMFECQDTATNAFIVQVFGPVLKPNRPYHLFSYFGSDNFEDQLILWVDGIEYTLANPTGAAPSGVLGAGSRGAPYIGDNPVDPLLGGEAVIQNAPVNMQFNHWAFFSGADAQLTTQQVREELFEKGALASVTISSDTEANMQTALDALADTVRPDEQLNIRVEAVSGGGDLSLDADNITHDPDASIHVQYMGTDTLTWNNLNGSDASIGSTPNSGTIVFNAPVTVAVNVQDATTFSNVVGARVYIEAAAGGPLTTGTVLYNDVTDGSGNISFDFDYSSDQPISGRVRRGSTSPLYKTGPIGGTIGAGGLSQTALVVPDE